jgi:hypothetical protein
MILRTCACAEDGVPHALAITGTSIDVTAGDPRHAKAG